MTRLTHLNAEGAAHIVDIADKPATRRRAVARARLEAQETTIAAITGNNLKKGDALAVARIAGIMAAKKTADLIPLCHPLALTSVTVDIAPAGPALLITATAETTGPTGVEMEALTAATIAALTLYDMAKAIDRAMTISRVELIEKTGGKSGDFFPVISVDEALDRIFQKLAAPTAETVPLARAHRRVLATPLVATHNQPPFDSSAMDGYAVRAAEVAPGNSLKLAGTSQAGARFIGMMEHGQCVRIFTGAPMPIGADAVVMQEDTRSAGNRITFIAAAKPGQNIRRQGMDFTRGAQLLAPGAELTPAMLTVAASANYAEISVTKRPRLAVLATGDELVPPGTPPGPDQIVASNSYGLVPLLAPYCDKVIDLGIVPDDKTKLEQALLGAFDYGVEVLVTTGGASVGERDYVRDVLIDLGVKLDFWKLRMRPGKPLMFGTRGSTLVFGLPGNPVSALVTATVLLLPALRQLTGHADPFWPRLTVPLAAPLGAGTERRHFRRANLQRNPLGMLEVLPIAETDSSHATSLAAADALIIQPENSLPLPTGELVEVIPLTWG